VATIEFAFSIHWYWTYRKVGIGPAVFLLFGNAGCRQRCLLRLSKLNEHLFELRFSNAEAKLPRIRVEKS